MGQDDRAALTTTTNDTGETMKQTIKISLAALCGIAVGVAMSQGLRAQSEKKPAYVVAEVQVTDPPAFQAYAAKVPATLAPYHGRYIVRGKAEGKEGDAPQGIVVMLAFDSMADATQWYSTSPYKDLIPEREKSARSRVYIVEGLPQ
jgi:uncharacterized protein (DUF1330 family)